MFIEGTPRYEAQDLWLDLTHVELDQAMQAGGAGPLAVAAAANVQAALDGAPGLLGPIAPLLLGMGPGLPARRRPVRGAAGAGTRVLRSAAGPPGGRVPLRGGRARPTFSRH
jgi:hypothetical protein